MNGLNKEITPPVKLPDEVFSRLQAAGISTVIERNLLTGVDARLLQTAKGIQTVLEVESVRSIEHATSELTEFTKEIAEVIGGAEALK